VTAVVVALIGLPGAGKSSIAQALERALGLHRICRDRIRAAMFPGCTFTPAEKHAAFRAVLTALEVNCAFGRSSVIDGMTFSRRADLQALDRVLGRYPVLALPIYLACPPQLARERIAQDPRPHDARDRSPELVDQVLARFDPPPAGCSVIDAAMDERQVCEAAIALVAAQLAGSDPASA
jgi:predicted kinase